MALLPAAALATLKRNALRRGVLGPSVAWKAVAVVVLGGPLLRRFAGKQVEVVSVEKLSPGQSVSVSAIPPSERSRRRRARRSGPPVS